MSAKRHAVVFCSPKISTFFQVLIIGGGDGGVLREVLKHETVESVTLCEIDEIVVNVSRKFLPQMAVAFKSSKLNLVISNGFEYLKVSSIACMMLL